MNVRLSEFKSELSTSHKIIRLLWGFVWLLFFRSSPRVCHAWRRFLLRRFGAEVASGVRIYPSARVYFPPNLVLEENSVIGPAVELYCVAPITIGRDSMVSQYSYLCAASHDYKKPSLPLIAKPISIEHQVWICADCFIGPGVTVASESVVAARAVVVRDIPSSVLVAGNPAEIVKEIDRQSSNHLEATEE